jgi:hypothetical protein
LEKINKLSPEEIDIVLSDERIIKKLKNLFDDKDTLEDRKTIIARELSLSKYPLNKYVVNFIRTLNINIEKLLSMEESQIKEPRTINELTHKYRINSTNGEKMNISIGQILGFDTWLSDYNKKNILLSMGNFFGDKNDGYHTRSLGMLEYTSEEIVEKLQYSFQFEPISIQEADEDKYCISSNGLHRYTVLRIHYLLEKIKGQKSETELNEKYTIPVKVSKIDYFKTYCNYLLRLLNNNISDIRNKYDKDYNCTGLVIVETRDGQTTIADDTTLKELVIDSFEYLNDTSLQSIRCYYEQYQSFKNFIDENFKEVKMKIINKKGDNNEHNQSRRNYS